MSPEHAARLLGVEVDASPHDVQQAFRRLARVSHPDAVGGDPQRFMALTEARDALLAVPTSVEPRRSAAPLRPSRLLLGTWIALLVLASVLSSVPSTLPLTLADPLVRYPLLLVGIVGFALTGRRPLLVLGLVALAATAVIALVFTTLGALAGLLLMIAPVFGLVTIGMRRVPAK